MAAVADTFNGWLVVGIKQGCGVAREYWGGPSLDGHVVSKLRKSIFRGSQCPLYRS